jgi:hypothetical protein
MIVIALFRHSFYPLVRSAVRSPESLVRRGSEMRCKKALFCVALILATALPSAYAAQLDPQQMALIKDAATSICNTVKDIKGEKTYAQIQGEVKGQLSGLLGKLSGAEASASGTGTLGRDAFEGLTQDATATAVTEDRDCRMKLFNKMFDAVTAPAGGANVQSGNCSIANSGTATGNSVNCGGAAAPAAAPPKKP